MKVMIRWLRDREKMMTMMNIYIISSWREHLQEAYDVMGGGVRWSGGRWGATLYFSLLFIFLQAASGGLVNCPDLSRGMETQ